MPWYSYLLLSAAAAALGGIVVYAVTRVIDHRSARLEVETSNPSVFWGADGNETVQNLTVANRGRSTATGLLVEVHGLPSAQSMEHNVLSPEPGTTTSLDKGVLRVNQQRLLAGDRIEVSFKFKGVEFDLSKVTVAARTDQGRAQVPPALGGASTSELERAIRSAFTGFMIAIVVSPPLLWVIYRASNGDSILPESTSHKCTRVIAFVERGEYANARHLIGKIAPQAHLRVKWLVASGLHDTFAAVATITNREPIAFDVGGTLRWTPLGLSLVRPKPNAYLGNLVHPVPPLEPGDSLCDTVFSVSPEEGPSRVCAVTVTLQYGVLYERRVVEKTAYRSGVR